MGIIGDLANKNLGIGSGFKDVQKDLINKADNISDNDKESLKNDIDQSDFGIPSNWSKPGPTVANQYFKQPEPEPEPVLPSISSYNPTAAKADWQKSLEDFVGNQVGKWIDNINYTKDKAAEDLPSIASDVANGIDDLSYEVNPLDVRKEEDTRNERKAAESRSGAYEYLNDIIDNSANEDDDQSYNQLTYGDAIDQIADKLVSNPTTELSDFEKSIISNRSDSWDGDWSLPYIMASDKAYRNAVNTKADETNNSHGSYETMNKLVAPEYENNLGPISWGQIDNGSNGANTNMGYYIDPTRPDRVRQEYNYQPYSSTEGNIWDYVYGTEGGQGKNVMGEAANNINNWFDSIANSRTNKAKENADEAGRYITLRDGSKISQDDFRNAVPSTAVFYNPSSVTDQMRDWLEGSNANVLQNQDTSSMTPVYMLAEGSDGTMLPLDALENVEVDPKTATFTVTGHGIYDGVYDAYAWQQPQTVSGTIDDLTNYAGFDDDTRNQVAADTNPFYYLKQLSSNDEDSIREYMPDIQTDSGTITPDDVVDYYNGSNVSSDNNGPANLFKENYESPWADGFGNMENIVPFMADTALGSWQFMAPFVNRVLAPVWSGSRAVADVQGLDSAARDTDGSYRRQDITPDQGYSNDQLYKKAVGEFADTITEKLTGLGSEGAVGRAIRKATDKLPVNMDAVRRYTDSLPARIAKDTVGEGVEEVLASPLQQWGQSTDSTLAGIITDPEHENSWKSLVWDPSLNRYDYSAGTGTRDDANENYIDNFMGGALFSLPLNVARNAAQSAMGGKKSKEPVFKPKRSDYSKAQDYNLDEDYSNYYDQYLKEQ